MKTAKTNLRSAGNFPGPRPGRSPGLRSPLGPRHLSSSETSSVLKSHNKQNIPFLSLSRKHHSEKMGAVHSRKTGPAKIDKESFLILFRQMNIFNFGYSLGSVWIPWHPPREATSSWASSLTRSRWWTRTRRRSRCWPASSGVKPGSSQRDGSATWPGQYNSV